jgi:AsmA protein
MKIVISLLLVVVLAVGVILALPFLIDLNKYQDQYKPLIEDALNRKVQLRDIRLTIWPQIGARVAGFTVLDDPAFDSGTFASLTTMDIGVKVMPLLGGKVEVENITLREPVISVIKNKSGILNASTVGRAGTALPKTPSKAPIPSTEGPLKILALLAVDRVSILGGKLTYRDLSSSESTEYILQDLEILLQSVRLGHSPSIRVGMLVQPLNLPVKLVGTFGPLKESTDIDAINLQLALGNTDFTITGKMIGRNTSLNISAPVINTANLPITLPLQKPIDVHNLKIAAEIQGQDVSLQNISAQLFDGHMMAEGRTTLGSEAPPFTSKMAVQGIQLGPVFNALATTQVSISGTAGANLAVQGRGWSMSDLTKFLEGAGHMAMKDGRIEGVNLLQEAISILNVAGFPLDDPKATVFTTIESDLTIQQGTIHIQRLLMDSHEFQATGGGTIGFDQTLNLVVNLNLSQDLSQKIGRLSPPAKLAMKEGRVSLPLVITGTTQAPLYGLDMKSLTGKVREQVQKKVEAAVEGLMKGTTKPEDLKQHGRDLFKELLGR